MMKATATMMMMMKMMLKAPHDRDVNYMMYSMYIIYQRQEIKLKQTENNLSDAVQRFAAFMWKHVSTFGKSGGFSVCDTAIQSKSTPRQTLPYTDRQHESVISGQTYDILRQHRTSICHILFRKHACRTGGKPTPRHWISCNINGRPLFAKVKSLHNEVNACVGFIKIVAAS